jgi:hypothetical protein
MSLGCRHILESVHLKAWPQLPLEAFDLPWKVVA